MRYILLFLLILFSGCSVNQTTVQGAFQTNSAQSLNKYYSEIIKLIIKYKTKLDKRNPKSYNKDISLKIIENIKDSTSIVINVPDKRSLKSYTDYLNYAFDVDTNAKDRSDYLIVGLYKGVYEAYAMNTRHKITAFDYNITKLQKLYKNIQIMQWKIKHSKDNNKNYLFLTWQLNWQVELLNIYNKNEYIDYENIPRLEYIKNKKETIFDSSNNSFEITINQILLNIQDSIKTLGEEPEILTLKALTSAIFLL